MFLFDVEVNMTRSQKISTKLTPRGFVNDRNVFTVHILCLLFCSNSTRVSLNIVSWQIAAFSFFVFNECVSVNVRC